jgi:hypothetical protein
MVTVRRERTRLLALGAVLLIATAWLALGVSLGGESTSTAAPVTEQERRDVVSTRDVADAVITPAIAATRGLDLRLLGLWTLPGLAAALAALRQRRRQHLRPVPLTVPVRARTAANRAPPSGSIVEPAPHSRCPTSRARCGRDPDPPGSAPAARRAGAGAGRGEAQFPCPTPTTRCRSV